MPRQPRVRLEASWPRDGIAVCTDSSLPRPPEGGGLGGKGVNRVQVAARGGQKTNAKIISIPTRGAGAVPPAPLLLWLFLKSSQIAPRTPPESRLVIHTLTFCS